MMKAVTTAEKRPAYVVGRSAIFTSFNVQGCRTYENKDVLHLFLPRIALYAVLFEHGLEKVVVRIAIRFWNFGFERVRELQN